MSPSYHLHSSQTFQSTLPRGERPNQFTVLTSHQNFNPRSREGSDDNPAGRDWKPSCISIHAPARGATSPSLYFHSFCIHFNPRSREGSDWMEPTTSRTPLKFQSTLPRGERPGGQDAEHLAGKISIHAPARGATTDPDGFMNIPDDFNPRSREGSDLSDQMVKLICRISIHAPARGATVTGNPELVEFTISIHAPARGATPELLCLFDQGWISIHAPARGATSCTLSFFPILPHFNPRSREGSDKQKGSSVLHVRNFNPRSREGSDHEQYATVLKLCEFQSTLPRGERPTAPAFVVRGVSDFNPRSREGSDKRRMEELHVLRISIHAPARGATFLIQHLAQSVIISIHAPARGATFFQTHEGYWVTDFNPRSREGSDTQRHLTSKIWRISIHAPARGATENNRQKRVGYADFNPRSREGSDNLRWRFSQGQYNFNPRSREGSDDRRRSKAPAS